MENIVQCINVPEASFSKIPFATRYLTFRSYIILKLELENKMENSCHGGMFVFVWFWVGGEVWPPYGMV